METNTTVYLSLEVWDHDRDNSDFIRTIVPLAIPFNEITASSVWTVKRFTLSDGAYIEIKFKIETCYGNFGGLGCSFCTDNYYTSSCNKYCQPVHGNYTCNTSGNKVCADHKFGEPCDICQKEWSGEKCEECAENYFPEKVCNVTCTAEDGRYTCSNSGTKVCNENWKGAECDNCADQRAGETCEKCSEGWGGYKCQECDQDYYPEGLCNVTCTEEKNKFTCKEDGMKACYKNWGGEECENCAEEFFGEFCDVFCKEAEHYNCSSTGVKVCIDKTSIAVEGRYTCSDSGTKVCNENWKGAECDNCADNTTGVGNNCKKFNNYRWVAIGTSTIAAVSTITAVVLIVYFMVPKRRIKEDERNLVTRFNKTADAEIPKRDIDSIKVGFVCADESEDIEKTYADVTILDNEP